MRLGGLVAYAEDLMAEQARRGHDVAYFFSGRYYPFVGGPRLKPWTHRGVAMFEVVNSPLYDHGRQPELELSEPRIERLFDRLIRDSNPDVVHIHELAGLPSSIIDVARANDVPQVLTLQDYFPLCANFTLFDADGHVCLRKEVGEDCIRTLRADPRPPAVLFEATLRLHVSRLPGIARLQPLRSKHAAGWLRRLASHAVRSPAPAAAATFQRRRDVNVRRLNSVDRLIAMSNRVAEIYSHLGVEADHLTTMHLTLEHFERIRPRVSCAGSPLTFGTLNGLASAPKGAHLLLRAVRMLRAESETRPFRLVAYGVVDPAIVDEARSLGVELGGPYGSYAVDDILEEIDVGIIPSIWEEAYAYVGIEFLAKGIPVIANAIGGMSDYVREGETGWLNRKMTRASLAGLMRQAIDDREGVRVLSERIVANRASIVKTLADHADEMDQVYTSIGAPS